MTEAEFKQFAAHGCKRVPVVLVTSAGLARSRGGLTMLPVDGSAALSGYAPRGAKTDPAPIEWQ